MKFLLSTLQLASLCALSSWSVSSQMVVSQSEDMTVVEGGSVNISCCWTGQTVTAMVIWKMNTTEIKKNRENYLQNQSLYCTVLILESLTKNQSGIYVCEVQVEIPILTKWRGNGTVITVISKDEKKKQQDEESDGGNSPLGPSVFVGIGLSVTAPVLLMVLVWFCCRRWKQDRAARVIYEFPYFDSETQDMDKNSTGSRGSSQWCQVPVYESFDYFEHVEVKKDG